MAEFTGIIRGNENLHALVKQYTMGELNKFDYLQKRRDLIDEITNYENSGGEIVNEAVVKEEVDSSTTQPYHLNSKKRRKPPESHSQNKVSQNRGGKEKWVVIAIIIMIAYFGINFFYKSDTENNENNSQNNNQTEKSGKGNQDPKELINRFSEESDWSVAEIDKFISEWQQIPESKRQAARQATWFYSLNVQIKKRYDKQKNLAQKGSDEAAKKQLILLQLATVLNT